jgi:hypothetical protein
MTRPIQDILDNADEIARRFEEFDPDESIEVPVEEYLVQRYGAGGDADQSLPAADGRNCDRPD